MRLIQASELSEAEFNQFVENNDQIKRDSLWEKGYVFEVNGEICGCFQLDQFEPDSYWLKQLYVTKANAKKLPLLLEVILLYAKQQQAKRIYAHSQQPVTDLLLDSFSFSLQQDEMVNIKHDEKKLKGHWWLYYVS